MRLAASLATIMVAGVSDEDVRDAEEAVLEGIAQPLAYALTARDLRAIKENENGKEARMLRRALRIGRTGKHSRKRDKHGRQEAARVRERVEKALRGVQTNSVGGRGR